MNALTASFKCLSLRATADFNNITQWADQNSFIFYEKKTKETVLRVPPNTRLVRICPPACIRLNKLIMQTYILYSC